jgi:hypothetical protein
MNQRVKFSDPDVLREMEPSELESYMPYMGMQHESFTQQQERMLVLVGSGMSVAAAGRAAGYKTREAPITFIKSERAQKALAFMREQIVEEVKFTQANAHAMYMEAYTASATATEMKNTTDSLVKLHGLVDNTPSTQVNVQINNASQKQLERMSDEELLSLVGLDQNYLEPTKENDGAVVRRSEDAGG